jgi:hypothetical protein
MGAHLALQVPWSQLPFCFSWGVDEGQSLQGMSLAGIWLCASAVMGHGTDADTGAGTPVTSRARHESANRKNVIRSPCGMG